MPQAVTTWLERSALPLTIRPMQPLAELGAVTLELQDIDGQLVTLTFTVESTRR